LLSCRNIHNSLRLIKVPEDAIIHRVVEVRNEIKSLLPGFYNIKLIVLESELPLDMAAGFNEHEGDLVREVALTHRQHQSILQEPIRVVVLSPYFIPLKLREL
jgi:hypothetical protein